MKKLNVVIPMAGLGSRFSRAGYTVPKPLVPIYGISMIQWVYENLKLDANYHFIVQRSHIVEHNIDTVVRKFCPNSSITLVSSLTDGAARTVLCASNLIDNDSPLLIVNSDNLIEWDRTQTMDMLTADGVDGGIITIYATGPKWSYARTDDAGKVLEVAEKVQISNHATTGHYYWARGGDYVKYAGEMIAKDIRHNNEFYVAPVYNQAIAAGLNIITAPAEKFWSVGTPEDLEYFLNYCHPLRVK